MLVIGIRSKIMMDTFEDKQSTPSVHGTWMLLLPLNCRFFCEGVLCAYCGIEIRDAKTRRSCREFSFEIRETLGFKQPSKGKIHRWPCLAEALAKKEHGLYFQKVFCKLKLVDMHIHFKNFRRRMQIASEHLLWPLTALSV
jgi:hypothetical protein